MWNKIIFIVIVIVESEEENREYIYKCFCKIFLILNNKISKKWSIFEWLSDKYINPKSSLVLIKSNPWISLWIPISIDKNNQAFFPNIKA